MAPTEWRRSTVSLLAETAVSVAVAALLVVKGGQIAINPMSRIGQVSILAQLQFTAAVLSLVIISATLLARRFGKVSHARLVTRLAWASAAAIGSGLVGGGTRAMLHGTPWPLNADYGDSGRIMTWALQSQLGTGGAPANYPSGPVQLIVWLSNVFGWSVAHSQMVIQVVLTALIGPLTYVAWRLLAAPSVAAGMAIVAGAPFHSPYGPVSTMSLMLSLPVLLAVIREVANATEITRQMAMRSAALGALLGLIFHAYSGWFLWLAPGVAAAGLFAFPWRRWRAGLVAVGSALASFTAVTASYLVAFVSSEGVRDRYRYFDTETDPAYFAAFRGDLGTDVPIWPPFGELGGVNLFSVLLITGLAAGIALNWRSWASKALPVIFAGAWLARHQLAGSMASTGLVQLYPRTTYVLLYASLAATVLSLAALDKRMALVKPGTTAGSGPWRGGWPGRAIAGLVAACLLAASIGSATVDARMPREGKGLGTLSWNAQTAPRDSELLRPAHR